MSSHPNSSSAGSVIKTVVAFFVVIWLIQSVFRTNNHPTSPPQTHRNVGPIGPAVNPIERLLTPTANIAHDRNGIGVAILMDTSGSMQETVTDSDGKPKPKIEIARRSALDLLHRIDQFVKQNPRKPVVVGVYEFSVRNGEPSCRQVVPMGPPNLSAVEPAIQKMVPEGATPIGDAIITSKRDLDQTAMSHLHILVVTDGESNHGYTPGDVADAISRLPEANRASIYFVAFDVAAEKFNPVRDAGGLVLPAANEQELLQTLNYVLTGKILVEQPETPKAK